MPPTVPPQDSEPAWLEFWGTLVTILKKSANIKLVCPSALMQRIQHVCSEQDTPASYRVICVNHLLNARHITPVDVRCVLAVRLITLSHAHAQASYLLSLFDSDDVAADSIFAVFHETGHSLLLCFQSLTSTANTGDLTELQDSMLHLASRWRRDSPHQRLLDHIASLRSVEAIGTAERDMLDGQGYRVVRVLTGDCCAAMVLREHPTLIAAYDVAEDSGTLA